MGTIDYYNNNAQSFYERTVKEDMSKHYNKFLNLLPAKASVLDAGCGIGRDSSYFLDKGYKVTAFDASEEMVKYTSQNTKLNVRLLNFQDMGFYEEFDGVWASASLLHVSYNRTRCVYEKICNALKPNGIFYASYKYGDGHMSIDGREFWNMTESSILQYLNGLFQVVDVWTSPNKGPFSSPSQMWLQFIAKKNSTMIATA